MDIHFKGTIKETHNCRGIWVNSVLLIFDTGYSVRVDRDETEYTIKGDKFDMTWNRVYVWQDNDDGNGYACYLSEDPNIYKGKIVKAVPEIEDDAEDGYEIIIEEVD